jgi:two-component system, response regulator, stage 0 sporulation protein A
VGRLVVTLTNESSKVRVLIVEDNINERKNLINFLGANYNLEICSFLSSGFDVVSEIRLHKPDVVLTDFLASDADGTNVLNKINSVFKRDKPHLIVMSSLESATVLEKSFSYGIDYYIRKPIIFSLLEDAILSVCRGRTPVFISESAKVVKIRSLVRSVGVPLNVLGYTYIVEALGYMLSSDKTVFLSEVYRYVCKNNETSTDCVEVAIRNAMKKAVKANNEKFKKIFGHYSTTLSNSIFLTTLKEIFFEMYETDR